MAIRDVSTKGAAPTPGGAGGAPSGVEKAMVSAGLVPQGGDAKQAAQQLLGGLRAGGFVMPSPAGAKVPMGDQLRQAIVTLQRKNNLPATGNLDAGTVALMQKMGIAPDANAGGKKEAAQKDGFERNAPALLKQEGGAKKNKAEQQEAHQAPNADFVDGLLATLGGGMVQGEASREVGGKAVFGAGKGTEAENAKGKSAVTSASSSSDSHETAGAAKKEADAPMQAHGLEQGTAKGVKVARGLQAREAKTDEKQRAASSIATADPTSHGVLQGDSAQDGVGDDGKKRRGRGGEAEGAGEEGDEQAAAGTSAEEDASERDAGNATSGDRDENDADRGNASDGDEPLGAGHYRMPLVSVQAWAAIEKIKRDVSEDNRATTYTWDVMFYRPAVYGPGQKAQDVLHLVVKRASAFDPVWQKAVDNLAALVHRFEKNAQVPTLDDVNAVLKQARVKEAEAPATFDLAKERAKLSRNMKA